MGTAPRPGRRGSTQWAAAQPPAGAPYAAKLRSAFQGAGPRVSPADCELPITCWFRAKSSPQAKPGGSAGRTARAGLAGNPTALPLRSPPAAHPPWPPYCYGNDVCDDPEAVGARLEGNRGATPGRRRAWGGGVRPPPPQLAIETTRCQPKALRGNFSLRFPLWWGTIFPFCTLSPKLWKHLLNPVRFSRQILPELLSSFDFLGRSARSIASKSF